MDDDARGDVAAVRTWYDRTAEDFGRRYSGTSGEFWQRFEERVALELLGDSLQRVLDFGCGSGRLSPALSARASFVVGAYISQAMIALAPHGENVHYCVSDATRAAMKGHSFDAVVSLGMLEYVADASPFLREILRILEPGGRVVFTCHSQPLFPVRAWLAGEGVLRKWARRGSSPRDSFFQPVNHRPAKILTLLKERGFVEAEFRGFHFPLTADAFWISAAIPARPLARLGKSAAAALDRRLGRARVTRSLFPLAMYTARKPR